MGSPNTEWDQAAAVMAPPMNDSSKDLPFEPASIIRLIRGFLSYDKDASVDLPDVEAAGMLLWDLSADSGAAAGLLELHLLPAISAQLDAFLAGKLPGQSDPADLQDPSSQHPAAPAATTQAAPAAGASAAEAQLSDSPAREAANQGRPASTSPATDAVAGGEASASTSLGTAAAAGAASANTDPTPLAAAAAAADTGDAHDPSADSSRPCPAPERIAEICCGIMANLYSIPAVMPTLATCADLTESLTGLMLSTKDPPVLSELCRLLTAALPCPEGWSLWLPVLLSPEAISWLMHIISNTLHPQLLERSLLLLAALLAATRDLPAAAADAPAAGGTATASAAAPAAVPAAAPAAVPAAAPAAAPAAVPAAAATAAAAGEKASVSAPSSAAAGEAAEPSAIAAAPAAAPTPLSSTNATQLLLQQGLLQALEAVLVPAAAPGARQQQRVLLQARCHQQQGEDDAACGSWSEEEEDQEAVSPPASDLPGQRSGNTQHHSWLYQDQEVLLALVTCLQQLGQDKGVVQTVLKDLPALPELLLQLMLACRSRDQQEVLELLLPVLVMFREGVGPLLCAPVLNQPASPDASMQEYEGWGLPRWARTSAYEQQPEPEEQVVIEKHTEGSAVCCLCYWVCLAGVLRDCGPDSLDAIDAAWHLLNVMSSADRLLRLFLLSSKTNGGVSPVWVKQQLQQLQAYIDGCRSMESCHENANHAERGLCGALSTYEGTLLWAPREAAGL